MGMIRLLLAMAVLNSHFTTIDLPMVDGHEAVLAFFAISGFYMALILDRTYETAGRFYINRFLSLYPIYLFALAISVALYVSLDVHPVSDIENLRQVMSNAGGFLLMTWTSLLVVGQELLFSLVQWADGSLHWAAHSRYAIWAHAPLVQAWSLSLEILFYAMAPWLVRRRTRVLVGLVAASLAVKAVTLSPALHEVVFFKRFFPAEFWLFVCGILAYRLHKRLSPEPGMVDKVALALLVGIVFMADMVSGAARSFVMPLAVLATMPFIFRSFGRFHWDRWLGKISYPFYLLHFTIIGIMETFAESPEGWHMLSLSLVAAALTHCLFEPGIELAKKHLRLSPLVLAPVPVGIGRSENS